MLGLNRISIRGIVRMQFRIVISMVRGLILSMMIGILKKRRIMCDLQVVLLKSKNMILLVMNLCIRIKKKYNKLIKKSIDFIPK